MSDKVKVKDLMRALRMVDQDATIEIIEGLHRYEIASVEIRNDAPVWSAFVKSVQPQTKVIIKAYYP